MPLISYILPLFSYHSSCTYILIAGRSFLWAIFHIIDGNVYPYFSISTERYRGVNFLLSSSWIYLWEFVVMLSLGSSVIAGRHFASRFFWPVFPYFEGNVYPYFTISTETRYYKSFCVKNLSDVLCDSIWDTP